jgi:hypothetical protein
MCGRVIQSSAPIRLGIVEGLDVRASRFHNYPPRWNGAPSQELLVMRRNHHTGEMSLDPVRWGLIPHFCDDPKGGRKPINAKCETVGTLPTFRDAYRRRRCIGKIGRILLPASGCEPSRSSPSMPMSSLAPKFTTGRGTGISAASRRRSRALRQRLLNDVVHFAMQWALNPHIRTFSCRASLLFAASRSLFAASRPTVCGCADRQVETA